MEENQIIDVSKIKIIPSDTEIPVHNNSILTKRPLCTNFPENSVILDQTEAITKIITDISEDIENNGRECINNIPEYVEELQAIFNPLNVEECNSDIFKDEIYTTIDSLDELKKLLSELLIRFDTNPKNYTKEDYSYLLGILYKSLIHLYEYNPDNVIVTQWSDHLSDKKVPSEKLVKETIDSLDNEITQVGSDLQTEIGNRQSEISRVEGLISAEESARILADQSLQNTKQDNLTAGANIQINGTTISATDTIYDDTVLSGRVTTIENKIPTEASSSNQLADKDYVDQNIATSSATFKGTYNSIQELEQITADNNDYAFVISSDLYGNTVYNRYKYDGTLWLFEYALNNSSFTQSLWNAINSGVTSEKVATYDGYLPLILAAL